MSKVGIIYDTFDPIHLGHKFLSKVAMNSLKLDSIMFVLSSNDEAALDLELRLEMCQLALKKVKNISLNKELSGKSLDEMVSCLENNDDYYLIVDTRCLNNKDYYKAIDQKVKIVTFGSLNVLEGIVHEELEMELMPVTCDEVKKGDFLYLEESVKDYILEHEYYLDAIVKGRMSEHRYLHSKSVQKVAVELARAHDLDVHKASIAGLLHDVCKQISKDEMAEYMALESEEANAYAYPVYHQWAGARFCESNLQINDRDVIEAIRFHTTGGIDNPYVYILFIADKIEPTRGYDASKEMELALIDLKTAYDLVKKEQMAFIGKE